MKSLLMFIAGILGLATVLGLAFFALKGGGLAEHLKTHDAALQELDEADRTKVLDAWVAELEEASKNLKDSERKAEYGPSIGDFQKEILSTISKADVKINALTKAWNESEEETEKADQALQETEQELVKAEKSFDKLSDSEKAELKKEAQTISNSMEEKYSDKQVEGNPEIKERRNNVRKILGRLGASE